MRKIIAIIVKNFKLMIRSRLSALIILFGPLLIMLIVGLAFSSSSSLRINVGYYTPEQSNLTDSFIDVLKDYSVKEYASPQECKSAIVGGVTHICILFPHDFSVSKNNVIVFQTDNSKINFFEKVVDSIENDFNRRAMELTEGMTGDILNKLNETQESITNRTNIVYLLKEENKALRSDIVALSSEVGDIDVTFNAADFRVVEIKGATNKLTKQVTDAKAAADDSIAEARSLISDLSDEIDNLNISDDDTLLDMMNESGERLNEIEDELNSTGSFNATTLNSLINNLSTRLSQHEDRMASAGRARDNAAGKALAISSRLNQSMLKIMAVEETFNAIYKNIASTSVTDISSITKPITKQIEPVVTEESQLNFFFPYLVVLIIMFIGLLLSSTLTIMEKSSQAYFRNYVTPTSDFSFVFGGYLTTMIVMAVQLIVILSIFAFYFHQDITTNLKSTLFILLLLTSFFTFLGMALGNVFNSEETGTLASVSISSVMLFVSDLIFPLERMPAYIEAFARNYNPFVIGSELLRKVFVHRSSLGSLGNELLLIIVYLALVFMFLIFIHKFTKRTFILRWSGYIARRDLRRQQEAAERERLYAIYRDLPETHHFMSKSKSKVGSLKELIPFVQKLDADALKDYVGEDSNEFADWVQNALKNDDLALRLKKGRSRGSIVRSLKAGLHEYQGYEKARNKRRG